ncbi:nuclease [Eikenella sp. NML96-A-049]|uniref:thermonuclease family protein n=1 Tax=Eikenella sp. NML070372 TaxID=1795829 RepID=UPI0007DEB1E7|nr:thermonuclease family protein [Eikenella sp. NML070372]OAM34539.1 nuclease [Eikenella sp. NML070372]OAM39634.1 nuclease [Eikenella sp. NML96-A-049]
MKHPLPILQVKGYLKINIVNFAKTNAVSFCGAKTNAAGFVKIGMAGYAMLLAACSTLPASAEPARNNIISGEVVRAWDGDTLHLQDHRSGQRHKLRLAGIDAPELEQAQGKACRDRLAEQVLHRQVQAEIVDTDRYGRKVAQIRLNGQDINRQQVADGCAWHYRRYAREWQSEAEYAAYAEAEVQAKNQRLGLWRQASPQAPWQFRHRQPQQYWH